MNKYAWHIGNIYLITCLLYCTYRSNITTHVTKIKQQNASLIYHAILIHVWATNMPLKCHIYVTCSNYYMCINEGSKLTYMPHVNSLPSIISWALLYTKDNNVELANDKLGQKLWPVWQSTYTHRKAAIWNSIGCYLANPNQLIVQNQFFHVHQNIAK